MKRREPDVWAEPYRFMDEIIANMRARIDMCRRLAATTHDERTAKILRQMADEGEADIQRLETERETATEPRDDPKDPPA